MRNRYAPRLHASTARGLFFERYRPTRRCLAIALRKSGRTGRKNGHLRTAASVRAEHQYRPETEHFSPTCTITIGSDEHDGKEGIVGSACWPSENQVKADTGAGSPAACTRGTSAMGPDCGRQFCPGVLCPKLQRQSEEECHVRRACAHR